MRPKPITTKPNARAFAKTANVPTQKGQKVERNIDKKVFIVSSVSAHGIRLEGEVDLFNAVSFTVIS